MAAVLALAGSGTGPAARLALEWKRGAPLPLPRSEVAATTLGRELVVVGGFLADGRSSARVDVYSPARDRWRRLPALPVAVNHAMAASDGRRLYVLGGYGAPTRAFVLERGRWRRLPDLPALALRLGRRLSVAPSTWSAGSRKAGSPGTRSPSTGSDAVGRGSPGRSRASISA